MAFSNKKHSNNTVLSILLVVTVLLSCVIDVIIKKQVIDSVATNAQNVKKYIIVLDAGHGGEDCGAVGKTGVYEKDLNLDITFQIGDLLKNNGYEVIYTRTNDALLYTQEQNIKGIRKISDLKNRVKIAEQYPDAIFISVHMNSFGDSKYSGLQVYYGTKDEKSYDLANSVQSTVRDMLQVTNNRKVKSGDKIYLLENVSSVSVLIECGFLSNAEECKKLSQKEYQKSLSFTIVCGIIEYMKTNSD